VSITSGSSTSSDGTSTPTSTGTFTYTCTVTDNAGNEASDTATYTVGRPPSGSGTTTPSLPKKIHSWTKITPGVVTIMKDFDREIGIKQIQIDVNNPAQNVKITVTKHDGKPAEVAVEKSGKVYQYLQIGAENFDNTLDKAIVEFRVGRAWATSVELGKNDIAVFRYNEAMSRWDELTTTSIGEDATYYYYEVELEGFSYFAISEKSVVSEEESVLGVEESKTWLWILVAIAIIAIIVWQMKIKKK
jgi:PGF-pre-PGF domain-containing protein